MSSWNSIPLEITSQVLGWVAFVAWSVSFYPQVILNFRRKSVVGLNFDFVVLNLTKHSSYLIYNATLFFSSAVQRQYRQKYGLGEMIPVAANDVAFSVHAVLLTAVTLVQIFIYDVSNSVLSPKSICFLICLKILTLSSLVLVYDFVNVDGFKQRGTQKVSKTCLSIVFAVWLAAAVCLFIALPNQSWLWLISVFNTIQVFMTVIKYIPQAVMNCKRKSTSGFSIGNILLDLFGGLTTYGQMAVQSIDQGSWVNFYGNIGKTLLSLVSIFFDLLFICQHYVTYASKRKVQKI